MIEKYLNKIINQKLVTFLRNERYCVTRKIYIFAKKYDYLYNHKELVKCTLAEHAETSRPKFTNTAHWHSQHTNLR